MAERKPQRHNPGRRRFLGSASVLGAGVLVSGCDSVSHNDTVQNILGSTEHLTKGAQRLITSDTSLAREFPPDAIAPTFRANGTTDPREDAYQRMAANDFADWRLRIDGAVHRPMTFSLADLRTMPARTQITRHDCVEGWSCIGQWTGAILGRVLQRVQPTRKARFVVFHCADHYHGGSSKYYESLDLVEAHHPQTLLAYDLNDERLPIANGAPLRLRAERLLGYKMAKYIMHIELVESFAGIHGGEGGYWEDRGYEWWAGV